ncbi:MAG TPA: potassium channel family protein, partial [Ktedonobacteraceae bacterium]|nr:potassium channel family protein [Ktedonobacteraceae bacterium]
MAANPTTENQAKRERSRKVTAYDLVIGILAIFSLILLIPIYFGHLSSEDVAVLNYLEDALCVIFLFDFFRSLRRAQDKGGYFFRSGGWLDLLGSIPISAFAIFRIARLFRIVRLLQKMTGGQLRRIFTGHLAENTLLFTLVIALILVFTIGWLVLLAEQNAPNANIKTYHDAVWWAFVTITTVGYGDFYPVTGWGQSFAVILMFFGLGIIGVLSSYLSSTFISLQRRRKEKVEGINEQDQDSDENEDEDSVDDEYTARLEAEL